MNKARPVRDPMIARIALGDLLRRAARRYGHQVAVRDGGRSTSFLQLDVAANRVANQMIADGLKPGERVVMLAENSVEFIVNLFGIAKAGLIWVPVNTMLPDDDILWIVDHSGAKLVLIDRVFTARTELMTRLEALGTEIRVTTGAADEATHGTGSQVLALAPNASDAEPQVQIAGEDAVLIMYTSGTTARPKGVMHSHQAVMFATLNNAIEDGPQRDDIGTALLPMFHCAQLSLSLVYLATGSCQVMIRGFDPTNVLVQIRKERINHIFALPLMYAAMLAHPDCPAQTGLRFCLYAMAPMPEPLLRRLIDEFCPNFALGSGQTEIFPMTTMFRPAEQLRHSGNIWGDGCILDDLAIMDDNGNLLPPGEIGEIVHRGPNAMIGYYRDQAATDAVSSFGWHHTGDLGMIREGQLVFVDRKKDMIKTGGENVSTMRVEEVLLRHPAVANATAVGLPHARWTEAVTGFIVLKPGQNVQPEDMIVYARALLSGFETPKRIVILDALPMTATGKVRKAELRNAHAGLFDNDCS